MIWVIIELLFLILFIVFPVMLYRSHRHFMIKFYRMMVESENAMKLYVQCLLIFLLLYYYVYAGGHFGEWGILLSTILCAVLFSFKRADKWLHSLQEDRKCSSPTPPRCVNQYRELSSPTSGHTACSAVTTDPALWAFCANQTSRTGRLPHRLSFRLAMVAIAALQSGHGTRCLACRLSPCHPGNRPLQQKSQTGRSLRGAHRERPPDSMQPQFACHAPVSRSPQSHEQYTALCPRRYMPTILVVDT